MTQLSIFDGIPFEGLVNPYPNNPKDGRGLRESSREAHHQMKDSGALSARETQVYDLLRANPDKDFTRAEIAKATKMTHGAACGRVNALLHMKLVTETRRRKCSVTEGDSHGVKVAA